MIHKIIGQIPHFQAGDETTLREVLHPDREAIDLPYSLAQATIDVGKSSLPHRLSGGELYIFRRGAGRIWVDGQAREVKGGELVFVPPGAEQYVENTGTEVLDFFCIVSPPWRESTEEIL